MNPEWKDVVKAENPDIAIFVETGLWDNSGDYELNQHLKEFNAYFYDEAPYVGYTDQSASFSTTGEAIFSRYPILDYTEVKTMKLDDGTDYAVTHEIIHSIVDINGKEVHIIGVHLKAGGGDFDIDRKEWEQEAIINYMDTEVGDAPLIYIGDLNSHSPDDTGDLAGDAQGSLGYGPVTMILYPEDLEYGQFSSTVHIFTDVFRTLNPDDPGVTYNVETLRSRIDYIFVNQYFNTSLVSSNVGSGTSYDNIGSDHYTVEAIISIEDIAESTTIKQADTSSYQKENSKIQISQHIEKILQEKRLEILSPMVCSIFCKRR